MANFRFELAANSESLILRIYIQELVSNFVNHTSYFELTAAGSNPSCIITSFVSVTNEFRRALARGGDWDYWRERALSHARVYRRAGEEVEDTVRRAFGGLRGGAAGGTEGGVSGAAWTGAPDFAVGVELSREYSRVQTTWRRANYFDVCRGVAQGRAQAFGVCDSRAVFRSHAAPGGHFFWRGHRGSYFFRRSGLP